MVSQSDLHLVSYEWYYKHEREWQPLPEWALLYISLGKHITQLNNLDLVIGLSIPTRYYAAILISLGISLAHVNKPIVKSDLLEHFTKLCNSPQGTPIIYHEDNRLRRGSLEGYTKQNDITRVKIHLGKTEKQYIPLCIANRIQLSHENLSSPNLRKRSKILKYEDSLLYAFMDKSSATTYQMESRLECTIVGDKNRLLREACEPLAVQPENKSRFPGKIQDLLRIYQKAQEGYRTDIQSDRTKNLAPKHNEVSPITIFDSASGFLKWRDNWQQSQWVVLLDRTETAFEEAVNTLNRESCNHLYLSDNEPINLPEPPQGVDMLVYKRAKL